MYADQCLQLLYKQYFLLTKKNTIIPKPLIINFQLKIRISPSFFSNDGLMNIIVYRTFNSFNGAGVVLFLIEIKKSARNNYYQTLKVELVNSHLLRIYVSSFHTFLFL